MALTRASQKVIPHETYRIQNVDFGSYLELSKVDEEGTVSLRPLKPVWRQHWEFIQTPGANSYRIQSAASTDGTPLYLCAGPEGSTKDIFPLSVTSNVQEATPWFQRFQSGTGNSTLAMTDKTRSQRFLIASEASQVKASDPLTLGRTVENVDENYKWLFIPVHPVITKGTYRIRNLNGFAIHMLATGVSTETQTYGPYQLWNVEPEVQGKIKIKAVSVPQYLSTEDTSTGGMAPTSSTSEPASWRVKSLGGFGFLIQVPDHVQPLTLSLNESTNAVAIEPFKNTRNQVWFFEQAHRN